MSGLLVFLFCGVLAFGVVLAVDMLRDHPTFWPEPVYRNHRMIFRLVHREDRAAYVRIMRRTFYVQTRDLNRAFAKLSRTIGKTVLPALNKFIQTFRDMSR